LTFGQNQNPLFLEKSVEKEGEKKKRETTHSQSLKRVSSEGGGDRMKYHRVPEMLLGKIHHNTFLSSRNKVG